ncbi:SDR family NAD(P)-dependent oxidoreductase [Actinopolymorpha pittospori]|uniref:NAD(P)-dependent dehydrogenase (Short-subunit alcohol dehydrogenase family) n=1 Tax=Actinopolymorpha pittospori TaxID=648752 RepID=A0A927MUG9_9ACTN|nr:SDR family oxidoreductase [Actinopolymorpha pittospori]MBE1606581.1 NAD(P)-dependent dehydrogenase (short-subunit alcohol dehydrogenase family) [Actinopolymorpha pittospori]
MSGPTVSSLADQVVIVTGAGSGIGRATARAFADAGALVLGVGRRADALEATAAGHPSIAPFPADITEVGGPDAVVSAAVDRWERVDVLVNNAGSFAGMPVGEVTTDGIDRLFAINVVAPSLLVKAALPQLRASHGAIVNVSSIYGHRPLVAGGHYAASKAALESLTRSWALELAPERIRVNAVAAGPTESEALASSGLPPEVVEQIKADETARIPLGRRGDPALLAAWIVRLADSNAAWVTGQVLSVDGGLELT